MKKLLGILFGLMLFCCHAQKNKIAVDTSKHQGLIALETNQKHKVLYSEGQIEHAKKQSVRIDEAYQFLSELMGPKDSFCLLVLSESDWERNAYSPVPGMPEYYKGNLIVGAGQNSMAKGYEEMIRSFPPEMTQELVSVYTNEQGDFDMKLFFDKLAIHELTHSFQDPANSEGFSISRWLEEIHANMGLYAFYKTKRPKELKYIMQLVGFSLDNPPPNLTYTSLEDFDLKYYELSPQVYGNYQMEFTKAAQKIIDRLGIQVLKPLNNFLISYDDSLKDTMSNQEFRTKLAEEVDPYLLEIIDNWPKR